MSSASDHSAGPKNPKARTFFQYGNDAANKANIDYAIQMYQEACKIEPDNLLCRASLRLIERRKFNNDHAKVGRLVGARLQPIRLRAHAAKSKGQWAHVLEVCEEAFVHNPWDVSTARTAAEAAEQLGYKELAQWLIDSVTTVANDVEFFKYAAHVHELNAAWAKAIACWERVKKLHPEDEDANRQINALSASATIMRSGLNQSVAKHGTPGGSSGPGGDASASEVDELRQPQLSPEERWMKEIQENPTLVGPYLHFAEHLKMRGKLDDAEKLLARGLKANPDEPSLMLVYAEVQVGRLQRAIASWEKKCRERPDDAESKSKLEQLQTMLVDYETKELRRRIQLQPGDLGLQFELGMRLARAGHHRDAIAAFQQARSSPPHRVQALHQAGLSFEAEGQLKLAERSYQEALKSADPEDLKTLNDLHYRLGRVCESMGNNAAAEEHYNEVAANDYGYLDVAQRLRSLN
ncbi:MAG: tetratricopeptide repeat protein [Isosphaeraceae bacterium]